MDNYNSHLEEFYGSDECIPMDFQEDPRDDDYDVDDGKYPMDDPDFPEDDFLANLAAEEEAKIDNELRIIHRERFPFDE